ncbi:RHO GDP-DISSOCIATION INHIBITOR [Salix purpurea]|uniref:RHO GDP-DISSOCIATION INHIBITOR n=1 Tax=Salix purpurea TaxID=77065 RepID=A0A9Q0PFD4_SALPP|nr:RHO GDP-DISSOCIATION INHIBITOR [Salix purpurea]
MESGKKAEAGPSTTTRGGFDGKLERKRETSENPPVVEFLSLDLFPGPLLSLKEQIEKDKEDDSLRRWKEKLLGCVESDLNGQLEPEVKFHSIGIISDDIGEKNTPLPVDESQSGRPLFALREGSRYQLKLTFSVLHNIVSGLAYSNTVWKGGVQVDQSKGMLGTFAPSAGTICPYFGGGHSSIWCAGKGNLFCKA